MTTHGAEDRKSLFFTLLVYSTSIVDFCEADDIIQHATENHWNNLFVTVCPFVKQECVVFYSKPFVIFRLY